MFDIEAYNVEQNEWQTVQEVNEDELEEAYKVFRKYFKQNMAKTGIRLLNDRGTIVRLCHA